MGRIWSFPLFRLAACELLLGRPPPLLVAVYVCVIRVTSAGFEAVFALFAKIVLARRAAAPNVLLDAVCEGHSV
jgi:hypothetical protein